MRKMSNLTKLPTSNHELRTLMRNCEQTEGMTVLEHGVSVASYYLDLIKHLTNGDELKKEWRLPEWCHDPLLLESLLPLEEVVTYQIYHDCGKPLCIEFDDEGRRHFPNHADVSYELWKSIHGDSDIAWLIKHDMEIHLARAKDAERIADTKYWATQLLTGLAEVHANASMFGGSESTSFKIKLKNLKKIGKRILNIRQSK
ncbi:HD domain-containing protein [Vibrio vulnificus]|nr:HD domain-containing protein [Vibrio vulnificus]